MTPIAAPTIAAMTPAGQAGCVDDDAGMKEFSGGKAADCTAAANMCEDAQRGARVKELCPKTCGRCGTTAAPTTATPTSPSHVPSELKDPIMCRDPHNSDPETWNCACHKIMTKKCTRILDSNVGMASLNHEEFREELESLGKDSNETKRLIHFSDCYQGLLCQHPKVCAAWKRKVCPCDRVMDNDNALLKISQLAGWPKSSCAAMLGQCSSKDTLISDEVGRFVKQACPKTCGMYKGVCPAGSQNANAELEDVESGWADSTPGPTPPPSGFWGKKASTAPPSGFWGKRAPANTQPTAAPSNKHTPVPSMLRFQGAEYDDDDNCEI